MDAFKAAVQELRLAAGEAAPDLQQRQQVVVRNALQYLASVQAPEDDAKVRLQVSLLRGVVAHSFAQKRVKDRLQAALDRLLAEADGWAAPELPAASPASSPAAAGPARPPSAPERTESPSAPALRLETLRAELTAIRHALETNNELQGRQNALLEVLAAALQAPEPDPGALRAQLAQSEKLLRMYQRAFELAE